MKKILFVLMVSFGLWTGCSKDSTTTPYTPSCDGTVKSYNTDVAPVIQSACAGCHGNLGTYSQLHSSQMSVRSAIVSGRMPQGNSLSTAQKNAIVCWIDSGAPNN
jgi:hypothetical protein